MDLRLDEAERALRDEVRDWLAVTLPELPARPAIDDWPGRREFDTAWQRRLFDAGYAGLSWPEEFGGRGFTPMQQLIFLEEMSRAGAPGAGMNFPGTLHAGPTLVAEASDEQRRRYLPPILRGEEIWCQGFSEPGAGSDLASLRTRADRDGDEYVITGQKIWTTHGHMSDLCEMLVRTDFDVDRKHKGITWLIVPMDTPGLTVRPIETLSGTSEFSEVFLDEARVPVANRVGDEGDGWRVTMVTLSFERGTAFVNELIEGIQFARHLADLEGRLSGPERALGSDDIRPELGWCAAQLDALWALNKRNVSRAMVTDAADPRGGSVLKLHLATVWTRMTDLGMRLLQRRGLSLDDVDQVGTGHYVEERLRALCLGLGGGTSEIQRNIIGERVLGLPKEPTPRTDRVL
jgi:alkylation response protein AidB-like acyl-CoA dehydrogenase